VGEKETTRRAKGRRGSERGREKRESVGVAAMEDADA